MNIKRMVLGRLATNCWIVSKDGECVVIDPGADGESVASAVLDTGCELKYVIFTHGHFDHVLGAPNLLKKLSAPVYMHPADEYWLPPSVDYDLELSDGMHLPFAGDVIKVLHTPGHTPGSCVLLYGDAMFSGDTLFAGSYGRCDLEGGSMEQMKESLSRLGALEIDYRVYPGHSQTTTLSREREINFYLTRK